MTRTRVVPILVCLLGLLSIAAIVGLQQRAASDRGGQLELASLRTGLAQLQSVPVKATAVAGGSPTAVRAELHADMRRADRALDRLRRRADLPELAAVPALLRDNYATLEQLSLISSSTLSFPARAALAARLLAVAADQMSDVDARLRAAGRRYDARASQADHRATTGAVAAILLLLLTFSLFYRRSVRAGLIAERLARENARLAAASGEEARTDALTGLRNRRALIDELERAAQRAGEGHAFVLALFDLDGFKQYNDTFGHPAGDALLARLGHRLRAALGEEGTAYRMGGDEFCVLVAAEPDAAGAVARAAQALTEIGDGFTVGCSHGTASLPAEAATGVDALRLADRRMYERKATGRSSPGRQSTEVLLRVLGERGADGREHVGGISRLARSTADRLGLPGQEVTRIGLAAELHDIGKTAIPDAILNKPGPLDEEEWEFMRRHTLIGERILLGAQSLAPTAGLVRSSHERFDGAGYPDALDGQDTPLGASIIAVCDAYDAMVSSRPYRPAIGVPGAIAELRRCAGTQFHPAVVDVFCTVLAEQQAAERDAADAGHQVPVS